LGKSQIRIWYEWFGVYRMYVKAKIFLGGAKYLSSFLKFEVKNRRISAEEAKNP